MTSPNTKNAIMLANTGSRADIILGKEVPIYFVDLTYSDIATKVHRIPIARRLVK